VEEISGVSTGPVDKELAALLSSRMVMMRSLWSPFQLSAIKMWGICIHIRCFLGRFSYEWLEGWIDRSLLAALVRIAFASALCFNILASDYSDPAILNDSPRFQTQRVLVGVPSALLFRFFLFPLT